MSAYIQLKVVKANGSEEEYFHTKVIGAVNRAMADVGRADMAVAEEIADVVTYFLYHKRERHTVTSGEILSMIKIVLSELNYEEAALAISEHHCFRRIKRNRIEVVRRNNGAMACSDDVHRDVIGCWDKSKIVVSLLQDYDISKQIARVIAAVTEKKVIAMEVSSISTELIKQIVIDTAGAMLKAEEQLQVI